MKYTKNGFSLIELMIALSITAILMSAATPSFSGLINKSRIESQKDLIADTMNLARITAITEAKPVTLCPSADGKTCTKTWNHGLMLFVDIDNNSKFSKTKGDTLLFHQQTSSRHQLQGNQPYFTYNQLGTLRNRAGSLLLCPNDKDDQLAYRIVVNKMGRLNPLSLENSWKKHYSKKMHCKDTLRY